MSSISRIFPAIRNRMPTGAYLGQARYLSELPHDFPYSSELASPRLCPYKPLEPGSAHHTAPYSAPTFPHTDRQGWAPQTYPTSSSCSPTVHTQNSREKFLQLQGIQTHKVSFSSTPPFKSLPNSHCLRDSFARRGPEVPRHWPSNFPYSPPPTLFALNVSPQCPCSFSCKCIFSLTHRP